MYSTMCVCKLNPCATPCPGASESKPPFSWSLSLFQQFMQQDIVLSFSPPQLSLVPRHGLGMRLHHNCAAAQSRAQLSNGHNSAGSYQSAKRIACTQTCTRPVYQITSFTYCVKDAKLDHPAASVLALQYSQCARCAGRQWLFLGC